MTGFARGERGQAVIVVGLAVAVLLCALALGLDWGYGLTQRRVAQNAADAAAIAAAKALAKSTVPANGSFVFGASQEFLYCVAQGYAQQNQTAFRPSGAITSLLVELSADASTWTATPTPDCPVTGNGTDVPSNTLYVRVVAGTSYRSLVASIAGQPTIDAQASARARIAGAPAPTNYPVWPMARHYDPADFNAGASCGTPCDPQSVPPVTFWSSSGSLANMVYGSFKGMLDYSRYSTRFASPTVPQLIAQWDLTGHPCATAGGGCVPPGTPLLMDFSGNCAAGWDTAGDEDRQSNDKQCSIPNWLHYSFGGTLSLSSPWSSSVPAGQESPSGIGSRNSSVCQSGTMPQGLTAPSCSPGAYGTGDWVETAFSDLGGNMSAPFLSYIGAHGTTTAFSGQFIPGSKTTKYGKAVVIYVYLWDCAETFVSSRPAGNQWDLITPRRGDCSEISDGAGIPTLDRVHLFTAAPFTFYEGLVNTNQIKGFWGGAFGDPRVCQSDPASCGPVNAFTNTAFIVPDE